ncbi:MAG TPA: GNAT family N-acetyltransferase [Polyangiales bacterium]
MIEGEQRCYTDRVALSVRQITQAGAVLAQAFHTNPGFCALLRDDTPATRLSLCTPLLTRFVAAVDRFGEVELIEEGDAVQAVALMFAPGQYPEPLRFQLMTAWPVLRFGPRRAQRFALMDRYMRKHHERAPHWYLWFLGVLPELQGRGLGSRLLRSLTERAARDGAPCYLETDKLSSVRLYERHGYVVQRTGKVPKLAFDMWLMKQPRA